MYIHIHTNVSHVVDEWQGPEGQEENDKAEQFDQLQGSPVHYLPELKQLHKQDTNESKHCSRRPGIHTVRNENAAHLRV